MRDVGECWGRADDLAGGRASNAMGIHMLDYLRFVDLGGPSEHAGRWEFLLAAAPLQIAGGTGSPLNLTANL